ncbi:MAG: cupin domain-containing protein [Chitinophagaceae bacterium]
MKYNAWISTLFIGLVLFASPIKLFAQNHENMAAKHIMINAAKLKWQQGPASLPKGAQIAILEGDMSKPEAFTVRLMLPANYKVRPHWHPAIEHVTVIQGAFYMGTGEQFKESAARKLSVGDFATMPVRNVHYAFTKGKTIVQLHGVGPWGITYVNEADDPRKK